MSKNTIQGSAIRGLETLEVWQRAMDFATFVCQRTLPLLPEEEKYALQSQLRRSVQAIPANIAEGYGRYHYLDNIRFCYMARGSLEETFIHTTLSRNLGYFDEDTFRQINSEIKILHRMINGYITFLKRSKRGENEPGSILLVSEDIVDYEINDFPE